MNILITGGSGGLGKHLSDLLLSKGHSVSFLSRKPGHDNRIKSYTWDVKNGIIDEHSIDGVDTVIHLAGAGIAGKRWTTKRKKELVDSRVKSIELVYSLLIKKPHNVKTVISASAVGYYSNRGDELMTETSTPATDFIAKCCVEWEAAVDEGEKLNLRVVKFRTGVVLDKKAGALATIAIPVKLYIGSAIGSGKQWISWIHWEDVVNMYLFAIDNQTLKGTFNMVAPNPVTNAQLTRALAKQLKKPLWAPKVPAFLLKILLGEMSSVVLASTKVACDKITDAGFNFKYTNLQGSLAEIYG